jgi:hypothetical protein
LPATLRIDAAGFARRSLDVEPPADRFAVDVGEIELGAGTTVHVLAEDEGSGRVARVDLANAWLEPDMLTAPVVDGKAVVRHVPEGEVTVSVVHGARVTCDRTVFIPEGAELMEVDCGEAGTTVRGFVEVDGYGAGPGLLSWRPPGERDHGVILESGGGGVSQHQVLWGGRPVLRVTVDDRGYFESEDLRPGTWEVAFSSASGGISERRRVELPEAADQELVLSFPGTAVRGLVTDADGEPVESARVRDLGGRASAITRADGSFSVSAGVEGFLDLQARRDDRTSEVVRVELGTGGARDPVVLVLEDRSRDRVVVRILGPDGRPIPGALVFLEEESKGIRLLTADAAGEAAVTLHPPRPPRVRAAASEGGHWQLGGWTTLEEAREGLVLEIGDGGSITLTTDGDPEPVQILSAAGWDVSWLRTRLGRRPMAAEGRPLTVEGLPPGTYEVVADGFRRRVTVEPFEDAEVRIESSGGS